MRSRLPLIGVLSLIAILAWVATVSAVELAPHRAIYRMALSRANHGSDVVGADGLMYYRFEKTCDGWTVENKTALRLTYEDDSESNTVWTFASWEPFGGRGFRFGARYVQDGDNVETLTGTATLNRAGGPGVARFREPPNKEIALPAGTVFPTEHLRQMLREAEAGGRAYSHVVFDGASLDNPYFVNALFGPLPAEEAAAEANALRLKPEKTFWVKMAFFPLAEREADPEFEISTHYRADGIAGFMTQRFQTFTLELRLQRLELLPSPRC